MKNVSYTDIMFRIEIYIQVGVIAHDGLTAFRCLACVGDRLTNETNLFIVTVSLNSGEHVLLGNSQLGAETLKDKENI